MQVFHYFITVHISQISTLLACLHDQNKSDFLEGRFHPANQNNLKSIQKALVGWKKSRPSTFILIM